MLPTGSIFAFYLFADSLKERTELFFNAEHLPQSVGVIDRNPVIAVIEEYPYGLTSCVAPARYADVYAPLHVMPERKTAPIFWANRRRRHDFLRT